jgi:hypothetical protein
MSGELVDESSDLRRQWVALGIVLRYQPRCVAEARLALPSAANLRQHWAPSATTTKIHRVVGMTLGRTLRRCVTSGPPWVILLVRQSPRRLDSDNMARACKGVRDGIAQALSIDDGSDDVEWLYSQRTGIPRVWAKIWDLNE